MRLFFLAWLLFSTSLMAIELKLQVGDEIPNYLGKASDGEEIFVKDNRGKVMVVTFWATWCPPCLKELPVLEQVQKQAGNDFIKVVAINFKEDKKRFRQIKKAFRGSELTLTHDRRGVIAKKFGVEAIPHMFIVGKDGKLFHQFRGYGEGMLDTLVARINQALESETETSTALTKYGTTGN